MSKVLLLLLTIISLAGTGLAQTTVKGRVTGVDGRPMARSNIVLSYPNDAKPVRTVEADKNGRYTLTIDADGIWILHFSGVGFRSHEVALYIDKQQAVKLDVQLESYRYLPDFSKANVVGDFNRWHVPAAVPMQKQRDGTWAADITTTADTVAYRLNGVRQGDAIEGTQADRYIPRGSAGYASVVKAKGGKVRLVLDPRKLVRSNKPAKVTVTPAGSQLSRFAGIYDELQRSKDTYLSASMDFIRSKGRQENFRFDWSATLSSLETRIASEPRGVLRQALYLNYLTIAPLAKAANLAMCKAALEEISPRSNVWLLNPHSMQYALDHSGFSMEEREKYVQQVLDQNPLTRIKAVVLFNEFMVAKLSDHKVTADRYYDILLSRFGDTQEAKMVMGQR